MENECITNRQNKNKPKVPQLVQGGFTVGILCLLVSIGIIAFFSTNSLNSGGADVALLFALPVLSIFPIGIALFVLGLRSIKQEKQNLNHKKSLALAIIGLACSLTFIISIPAGLIIAQQKEEEWQRQQIQKQLAIEAAEIKYNTEPTIVYELGHYRTCYTFHEGANFRAGRDAICSYLRYTYSHDWQEPQSGKQLDSEIYTPNYFLEQQIGHWSDDAVSAIAIVSGYEVTRDTMGQDQKYFITPHKSCSREENDSIISVWYLDNNDLYDTSSESDLVCMYYDYHQDTMLAKLNKYENTSFNIYRPEFADFYEELLKMIIAASGSNEYDFSIPYPDEVYSNRDFITDFISSLPSTLSTN